ncbi:MAG TPA: acriflavine resistance protein B [Verrucomicrobia bacterium]|nr:MAG: acriflavine resistance protein B [Lentisphaerae bacterium GWF2_57_35]HBA82885.1 acriflavine resistance protein B [Verrucomicrobiota bacterium]
MSEATPSFVDRVIRFCLEQKLVVALLVLFIMAWGVMVAPFDWNISWLERRPVPVDAIPDIGENQQIVFTEWMGRSPKDVDDQISYPLTVSLLGIPDVKTIRSYSMFGFSMIYIIFEEGVEFEAAQNRIIARLNGLPAGVLPEDVKPALGPYATALGQVFWYTLEGRDPDGKAVGGWDLEELRTVQDWTVRYYLQSAEGITEVASIGGFVQEYQVDVDPDAMRAHGVSLEDVFNAVRNSNLDVGARQIELNRVEYLIRARGFIKDIKDVEGTVVKVNDNVPIYVKNVAHVNLGPAYREGALDKEGAEAVGAVVVVRHGYNPLAAIKNVKVKVAEMAPSLPVKAVADYEKTNRSRLESFAETQGFQAYEDGVLNQTAWVSWLRSNPRDRWPEGLTTSQVTLIPFYDRTGLIYETLGTLNSALYEQVLITTIVVIIMASRLGIALLISVVMPLSVFLSFIAMKLLGVDANLVSLSGIAIAIGTIVDMGIIMSQNIIQHLERAGPDENRLEVVYRAASEVGSAILTAIATTVVGFLPVFAMSGAEGRLFKPLAFTKTFCLIGSVIVGITVIPAAAHMLLGSKRPTNETRRIWAVVLIVTGLLLGILLKWWLAGWVVVAAGIYQAVVEFLPERIRRHMTWIINSLAILLVGILLTEHWMPLGPAKGFLRNFIFVGLLIGLLQGLYFVVERNYGRMLRWFLAHKAAFLAAPALIVVLGYLALLGVPKMLGFIPAAVEKMGGSAETVRTSWLWTKLTHGFPGFGKEFMPPLDEGAFLYMPTTMPHASIGEALDVVQKQDMALRSIPEVDMVVGKIGRANTAIDPAPINMVETVITYKPEFVVDQDGRVLLFKVDRKTGAFEKKDGELVPDPSGKPYRQWREQIRSPDDIWKEIVKAAEIPGSTTAPKLQPIAARLVMLQSGMRAPMGVKVKGPDLESIERAGLDIERFLKEVPSVEPSAVIADRIVGKPYLEIEIDREAIARYGLKIQDVQDTIEVAVGGVTLTTTVEGRRRFPVRVRYLRELRDRIETLGQILIPAMSGAQIPLTQLADIRYVRGPEAIKSEDTFLISYVLFDKKPGFAEVDVVEACQEYLDSKRDSGEWAPPAGVTYRFAGNYENQIHAQKTLSIVLPLTLFIIFMLIYFQFRSVVTTSLVFTTIFVCWGGGLLFIWLYGQSWFLDFSLFGVNMRNLFQVHPVNMSIAVWVGFLALFGIASDDAVVMCTYLDQRFAVDKPKTVQDIRDATVLAGERRVRACLMTTATTVLALLPVLTSTGRGSDIMVPMSLPSFGGMIIEVLTMFLAPILYCAYKERQARRGALQSG